MARTPQIIEPIEGFPLTLLNKQDNWRARHPERMKEIKRNWYHKNKERLQQERLQLRLTNPEIEKRHRNLYYQRHREECLKRSAEYQRNNPDKVRKWRKNYREKHGHKLIERQKKIIAARNAIRDKIKLEKGCIDCGYKGHPVALDFDHVRGEKVACVSRCLKPNDILREIEKCEVRCANCHRIKTYKEKEFNGRMKLQLGEFDRRIDGQA